MNGTSPVSKITKAVTPPITNGVKPAIELSKALRPTLNPPQFQVPMVRVVRPQMVMQPVCPPGTKFQTFSFTNLTLDYFRLAVGDVHQGTTPAVH